MSDDTISRQDAIDAIEQHKTAVLEGREWDEGIAYGYAAAHRHLVEIVRKLPSAERHGRWKFNIDDKGWSWDRPYVCDQCGEWNGRETPYCPNCGARMEAE